MADLLPTHRPTIGFGPAEGVAHSLDSAERTSLSQLSIPTSARSSKELELEVDAEVVVTEINTNGWWKGYDGKDLKQKEKMFLGSHVKICNFTHSVMYDKPLPVPPVKGDKKRARSARWVKRQSESGDGEIAKEKKRRKKRALGDKVHGYKKSNRVVVKKKKEMLAELAAVTGSEQEVDIDEYTEYSEGGSDEEGEDMRPESPGLWTSEDDTASTAGQSAGEQESHEEANERRTSKHVGTVEDESDVPERGARSEKSRTEEVRDSKDASDARTDKAPAKEGGIEQEEKQHEEDKEEEKQQEEKTGATAKDKETEASDAQGASEVSGAAASSEASGIGSDEPAEKTEASQGASAEQEGEDGDATVESRKAKLAAIEQKRRELKEKIQRIQEQKAALMGDSK